METIAELRKSFEERAWRQPFNALPMIDESGLVLGHGTVLARMGWTRKGEEKRHLACGRSAISGASVRTAVNWLVDFAASLTPRDIFKKSDLLMRMQLIHTDYPGNSEWPYPKKVQNTWARGRQKS